MPGFIGHRYAPVKCRARDRQILEARLYEGYDFVAALVGTNEIRMAVIIGEKPVAVVREPEEVALLLDPFDRCPLRPIAHAVGADLGLFFLIIGLVADGIPAGIAIFVNVAGIGHPDPEIADGLMVPLLCRADEIVVRGIKQRRHVLEFGRIPVGELDRLQTCAPRRLLHLLAMLVSPGEEKNLTAIEPLEPGKRVGGDQFIGMADVRPSVRIRDRGRNVEG